MDVLNTGINAAVVAVVGILLGGYLKGRFDAVDRRFDQADRRFEQMEARLAAIEGRLEAHDTRFDALEARMGSLERSVDGLRSDLTRVALAVGAGPASEAGG
jgi:septal ring factor EnvC (AmiA/AmiB activator)